MQPLILTLLIDEHSFKRLNAERKKYFPPHRNSVPAHISLFHKLPQEEIRFIYTSMTKVAQSTKQFAISVKDVQFLGAGVAYTVVSSELSKIHAMLKLSFGTWLTAQDMQPFSPHVTIQNKVSPEEARLLYQTLIQHFQEFTITVLGLNAWEYQSNGSWILVHQFKFVSE